MEALTAVVESGKARHIGFSEWTPEQIRAGLEVPGAAKFVSSQPQYNMIWRAPEAEVFPLCAEHGISQIVWSPLAQGVLSGKYAPGAGAAGRLARGQRRDELRDRALHERRGARGGAAACGRIAEQAGLTMVQLALAWVLRREELASAIVGASRPEQVHANAEASGGEALADDTLAAIDEALADVAITEPTAGRLRRGGRQAPLAAATSRQNSRRARLKRIRLLQVARVAGAGRS